MQAEKNDKKKGKIKAKTCLEACEDPHPAPQGGPRHRGGNPRGQARQSAGRTASPGHRTRAPPARPRGGDRGDLPDRLR
eukprot:9126767-Pyramimonas_sp.AAC.1